MPVSDRMMGVEWASGTDSIEINLTMDVVTV